MGRTPKLIRYRGENMTAFQISQKYVIYQQTVWRAISRERFNGKLRGHKICWADKKGEEGAI